MSEPQKTSVRLKVDDVRNIPGIVDSHLNGSNPSDLVLLQLDSEKFPRRIMDFPEDVRKYVMTHPRVKVVWDVPFEKMDDKLVVFSQDKFMEQVKAIEVYSPTIENTLDMSLISCHYGGKIDFCRKTAMRQAMYNWFIQKRLPNDIIFVELVIDDNNEFSQQDFPPFVKYIRINGNEKNKGLFQKECLWNIGASFAKNNKLVFVDYDTSPIGDQDWFTKIYHELDNTLFTQGFRTITYLDQNGGSQFRDYCMTYVMSKNKERGDAVPGGAYCIRRELYDCIGGFNNKCFSGCGDAVLFNEIQKKYKDTYFYTISVNVCQRDLYVSKVIPIVRKTNMKLFGSLDVDLFHFYHGQLSNRSYNIREYLAMLLYPFENNLRIDETGLISWKKMDSPMYKAFCNINKINNSMATAQDMIGDYIDLKMFKTEVDKIKRTFEKTQSEYLLKKGLNRLDEYIKLHKRGT